MILVSIVGARPQFVKMAVFHRAVAARTGMRHVIVHTGQHYDAGMSGVFFEQLGIPAPQYQLDVGSGSHAAQTGEMLKRLEPVLQETAPDWVVLYGDTNSTLAGALTAAKLHLPLAHVEAGLRSWNRKMPEEINRIVADQLSNLLFCPTQPAMDNLAREGLLERARRTGDIMYDAFLWFRGIAKGNPSELSARWHGRPFALATVHRAENTDHPERLTAILDALEEVSQTVAPVLLPLHPRTRQRIDALGWRPRGVQLLGPVPYLDMLSLEASAQLILTDSGGVQKEAYFARRPCVTLRDETEWVETLHDGCNVLAGASPAAIAAAAAAWKQAGPWTDLYGDGRSGEAILDFLAAG
ncbi:MAG: UDP-N-acetylglucosamine 2-epimerase (non-hydrolyzing) [Bryobacterales bacterium]|nr:UDP-N-acetylglucosamine 2-epimerase (non-hydrolyzing) [Bryobacterales bacterium]